MYIYIYIYHIISYVILIRYDCGKPIHTYIERERWIYRCMYIFECYVFHYFMCSIISYIYYSMDYFINFMHLLSIILHLFVYDQNSFLFTLFVNFTFFLNHLVFF